MKYGKSEKIGLELYLANKTKINFSIPRDKEFYLKIDEVKNFVFNRVALSMYAIGVPWFTNN